MPAHLTIGEFSKMTYLSVKALRHYHDVGLLEPAEIDPSSGYRRYVTDQVATAQAIRRFRELDMPLDQVRAVLLAPDDTTRNRAILDHLEAMQEQLERTQQTVASLQALLSPPSAHRPVSYRTIEAATVLAIREQVLWDDAGAWCEAAFAELNAGAPETAGPDAALFFDEFFEAGDGDVLAYVPVAGDASPSGRATRLELPAVRVAVMVHDGPLDDLDQTYGALGTAVAELGLSAGGPIRELYLADDHTEVCWPIVD